ncbi:hypothetical protein VTN77DRAFT_5511 [Rasamsonia byssochlamydoides]|uniref:uncharacterized protein n=1 Tax=Rasamsonia byssochlamydoides TaxID=89139 RepID=UPI0037424CDE
MFPSRYNAIFNGIIRLEHLNIMLCQQKEKEKEKKKASWKSSVGMWLKSDRERSPSQPPTTTTTLLLLPPPPCRHEFHPSASPHIPSRKPSHHRRARRRHGAVLYIILHEFRDLDIDIDIEEEDEGEGEDECDHHPATAFSPRGRRRASSMSYAEHLAVEFRSFFFVFSRMVFEEEEEILRSVYLDTYLPRHHHVTMFPGKIYSTGSVA